MSFTEFVLMLAFTLVLFSVLSGLFVMIGFSAVIADLLAAMTMTAFTRQIVGIFRKLYRYIADVFNGGPVM